MIGVDASRRGEARVRRGGGHVSIAITRTSLRVAASLLPCLLLAAPSQARVRPAPADTVVVGLLADPVSLDPRRATDLVSAAVISNVCEPLVRFHHDGTRPEPALATTWATRDNRTWTFTLRPGVRFHDGEAFDAEAVVANVLDLRRRHAFPGSAHRVGRLVIEVQLERANAALLATLSQPFFAIQSPRQLASDKPRPVGTGPFRLASDRPGLYTLEASAAYWGGAPRLARLVFQRLSDEDGLVAALRSGSVDVTSAVGLSGVAELRGAPGVTLDSQTGLNLAFLSLNNERPPLDDRRVRQAIARSLDRTQIVAQVLSGHGEAAHNPLPPSLLGYSRKTRAPGFDLAAARRLLAEAGRAEGFETTLLVSGSPRPYLPAPRQLAERLREDLGRVGIRTRLIELPSWAAYVERATRGDYDLAVLGWQADTPDPNDFLSALLGGEAIGATNRSRYRSPDMEALLKRGRRAGDAGLRLSIYRETQELFQRDMPWVPLYHAAVFTAHRRALRGLVIDPMGVLRYDKAWKAE